MRVRKEGFRHCHKKYGCQELTKLDKKRFCQKFFDKLYISFIIGPNAICDSAFDIIQNNDGLFELSEEISKEEIRSIILRWSFSLRINERR